MLKYVAQARLRLSLLLSQSPFATFIFWVLLSSQNDNTGAPLACTGSCVVARRSNVSVTNTACELSYAHKYFSLKNYVCKGTDANMLLYPLWYKMIVGLKYLKSFFQIPNPRAQRAKNISLPIFPLYNGLWQGNLQTRGTFLWTIPGVTFSHGNRSAAFDVFYSW